MNNTVPQIYNFDNADVRIIIQPNGDPLFVASDVCSVLELANVGQALSRLDEDEKTDIILNDVTGRPQAQYVITESGLYSLVLGSRKPEAKAFKKWITSVVLPQIRKTGSYSTQPQLPATFAEALRLAASAIEDKERVELALLASEATNKQLEEKSEVLETKVLEDKPKVQFCDAITASNSQDTLAEVAQNLASKYPGLGRNLLVDFLRKESVIQSKSRSETAPLPYQHYVSCGYFFIKYTPFDNTLTGKKGVGKQTMVTARGLKFIEKKLDANWSFFRADKRK
ncbi:phage antirepressor KilAC domain-containing protein [Hymenobacter tibetensis]|uniref:Phage antirepressor KilAC domain-containing protein n=1 Tax=Hymenobacter tibetensis TaxID=497967 RepID=A0ABY4D2X1_9BACT|nr:phage antirepressor KilAC domain-containing protein [Hymenobacter tibetensis]UOG76760.1 phage antirepressor KilAC domain-containing protein [Hymenobacter tibetensis]